MEAYAGIDLHSSNSYIGIIDEQDGRHFSKRLPNSLTQILVALEPFKKDLKAVVVESTYNWYWLVNGLQEAGYKVHLANPSAIKQYEGLKHTDDKSDSFWLAHLKRLNILPEGYIYPKEERPIRDILRRRLLFVRQRTAQILSFQSAIARNLSLKMSGRAIKKLKEEDTEELFDSPFLVLTAKSNIAVIQSLTKTIKKIENAVKSQAKLRKEFQLLKTIPGIGDILTRKHLSVDALFKGLHKDFLSISDHREGDIDISMADALMSGFAVFSLKDPSLLAFDQRRETGGNLESIYHVKSIPCDSQMRTILDEVDPVEIRPAYKSIFQELQRGKALEPMVFFQGCYLLSLDGTGYFSSKKIFSDNCLEKVNKKTGEITYYQSR